jgi:hypothetical protein
MKSLNLQPNEPVLLSAVDPVSKDLRIFSFVFEFVSKVSEKDTSSLTPRLLEWSRGPGHKEEPKSEKARRKEVL